MLPQENTVNAWEFARPNCMTFYQRQILILIMCNKGLNTPIPTFSPKVEIFSRRVHNICVQIFFKMILAKYAPNLCNPCRCQQFRKHFMLQSIVHTNRTSKLTENLELNLFCVYLLNCGLNTAYQDHKMDLSLGNLFENVSDRYNGDLQEIML